MPHFPPLAPDDAPARSLGRFADEDAKRDRSPKPAPGIQVPPFWKISGRLQIRNSTPRFTI